MERVTEIFGSQVFSDRLMQERLPRSAYMSLHETIEQGKELDASTAEIIAGAMKDWAIEQGATHYTHWFQPMTGITAEKHDSFISPTKDGKIIMEFSGKNLIKGEPDASSFPSGGLRATFEARGYTAWDCTSPAFIKDHSLCIPTAFCSYKGEALDKKTPLLRSMEAMSKQALRLLRLFGNESAKHVMTNVGPEQEYFLIDKKMFDQRPDLIYTGRTLFGARPSKGQELDDHYFGSIKDRISVFMKDIDRELWKLGITAKTKHNEVAPAQHELASIYNTANIATDHNQLVMDIMQKTALKHDLVCLLHEKPFAGVNGSGKHVNWSITTDDGQNLLDPGSTPHENIQFIIFLCAVIEAVNQHADLLRVSAANPGNDHRLGAHEAPPAIISIYLGERLTGTLLSLANGETARTDPGEALKIGVSTLPSLPKDASDRNRTSPFAFTGNKFEFRMVPSSASVADPNYVLNTIVADSISNIADRLEKASDMRKEILAVIRDVVNENKQVIFNGNNYAPEWIDEAKKRGLPNIDNMVDACMTLMDEKNIAIFEKHCVLTRDEMRARGEVMLEHYAKTIRIEALTTLDLARASILPACMQYTDRLAEGLLSIKAASKEAPIGNRKKMVESLSDRCERLYDAIENLKQSLDEAENGETDNYEHAKTYRDQVGKRMSEVRAIADELELNVDKKLWPLPTYGDLLFNI